MVYLYYLDQDVPVPELMEDDAPEDVDPNEPAYTSPLALEEGEPIDNDEDYHPDDLAEAARQFEEIVEENRADARAKKGKGSKDGLA